MADAQVTHWDLNYWRFIFTAVRSTVRYPHKPTIRCVVECLGLSVYTDNSTQKRGPFKFEHAECQKLYLEVTDLAEKQPLDRDTLLKLAAEPHSLDDDLEKLLKNFGIAIWGRNTDRKHLLTMKSSKKQYPRDLFYPDNEAILKTYLHRLILLKACHRLRNGQAKQRKKANECDTVADMEVDGDPMSPNKAHLSPNSTPQSVTPSTADGPTTASAKFAVQPINGQKRKRSAYVSLFEGDEMALTPAEKRYQSDTMQNAPRKSTISIVADRPASENVLPVPSPSHSHSDGSRSATIGATTSDITRPQLTMHDRQRSSRASAPIAPAITSQSMHQAQPAPVPLIQSHQSPRPGGAPIAAAPATQPHLPYAQPAAARAPPVGNVAMVPQISAAAAAYGASQAPPVLRSHSHEASLIPSQAHFSESDLGLLQSEVLGRLMQYLFPRITSPPDEGVLLHKIESLWQLRTVNYRKVIGQLYDLHAKILMTWITERRKIQQLRHEFAHSPAVPATEMVERLMALNDLRMMRLKWKNMSNAVGPSAEDLLCRTFTIMTNTAETENLFKDGLDRLNEGMFEFLRTEDMRIIMHSKR